MDWVCRLVVLFALIGPVAPALAASESPADRALAIAERVPAAHEAHSRGLTPGASSIEGSKWAVRYAKPNRQAELEIDVDLAAGAVERVWTGAQASFPMARGYPGWFGGHATAPYIWLPLCALFLALFMDWRHWRAFAHLDLLALIGFGVSQWFFQRGSIGASVPLAYVPLIYLLVRMALVGTGRARRTPLSPRFGRRTLLVILVALTISRAALNLIDTNDHDYVGWGRLGTTVIDVGYAGVVGADRLQQRQPLYTEHAHLDTYGPLNYVAYIPFERIWPFEGAWDRLIAARVAAITFDLIVITGLLTLGLRMRPGKDGQVLGLGLALGWVACPYSTYALNSSSNDALVAASLVWALVVFRSAALRALVIALGAGAKIVPAALLPAVLRVGRETSVRAAVVCVAVFACVLAALALIFAPPEGVDLLWRHTVARQGGSASPFSIWERWSAVAWLRLPTEALVLGGAGLIALRRQRDVAEAAALAAALILGVEITALHWIYFYIVWFLPLVLIVLVLPSKATSAGAANQAT